MPFSPVQLVAGMDLPTMISVINENNRQIEAENRTKVMRDEDGVNRVILGEFPDGTYGFAISKKGVDVLKAVEA